MRLKSTVDSNGIIPLAFELLFRKDDYISPPVFRNSYLLHLLFIKIDWRLKRSNCRSSHSQMFLKVDVLKTFAIFTQKHLCWRLRRKERLQHRCFPVNITKVLRTALIIEYLRWLLLKLGSLGWYTCSMASLSLAWFENICKWLKDVTQVDNVQDTDKKWKLRKLTILSWFSTDKGKVGLLKLVMCIIL